MSRFYSRKLAIVLIAILALSVVVSFVTSSLIVGNQNSSIPNNTPSPKGVSGVPAKVVVSCTPKRVFADNAFYRYIVKVELQDLGGNPAHAPEGGITVSLLSSDRQVGYTVSDIHISVGKQHAAGNFYSTFTPGKTVITASASGLLSSSVTVSTWGRIPRRVKVFLVPDKLLANSVRNYYALIVALQDGYGRPALAPNQGVQVSLSSSDTDIAKVPSGITISAGKFYAATYIDTKTVPGSTSIAASAAGLKGNVATLTTVSPGVNPASKLKLWLAPKQLPASGAKCNYVVVVQQRDSWGIPVEGATSVTVGLSSSDSSVGTVPGSITISAGKSYTQTYFTTAYRPGSTTISATSTGLAGDSEVMTTDGNTPSKLAVLLAPCKFMAHKKGYSYALAVQVQDNAGNPARAPSGGITLSLSSSDTSVGTVSSPLTIGAGQTYTYTSFTSTYKSGETYITASGGGITLGQAKAMTKAPKPETLSINLGMPKVWSDGKTYNYIIRVMLRDYGGAPAFAPAGGIVVSLASLNTLIGTVQGLITISEGTFFAFVWFKSTSTPGSTTITASATIGGSPKTASATITTVAPTTNPPAAVVVNPLYKYHSIGQNYLYTMFVYLLDAGGNPAMAPTEGVYVSLTSGDPRIGTVVSLSISSGKIHSVGHFYSTWMPGVTIVKASAADCPLTSSSVMVRTGLFTSIVIGYNFKNFVSLFYSTAVVTGDAANAREPMGGSILSYALTRAGTAPPTIRTDGLVTFNEYNTMNLILVGYNNTKTTAKNAEYGIIVNEDAKYFNITAEGKSITLQKASYPTKSIGLVYLTKDGDRSVMLAWGYGWQGTYAAALFVSDPAKRLTYSFQHMLMLSWNDINTNGLVELDEISVVDSA